jgi:molecular chaperone GrpE
MAAEKDKKKRDKAEAASAASGPAAESTEESAEAEAVVEDSAEASADTLEEIIAEASDAVEDVAVEAETLSEEDTALLDLAAADLVAEMRSDMLRAQAELVNFRTRVERDRVANRESVIAEVIRSLLPALDDLTRAEKHGDLEGSPLQLVATKIRTSFERYGLRSVGEKGELFDPHFHEAVVQLPTPGATEQTVADVIDPGYALGERLIRAAKVAVSVPE